MNSAFLELQLLLPTCDSSEKLHKLEILTEAVHFVKERINNPPKSRIMSIENILS
jgi:hypothetical protein